MMRAKDKSNRYEIDGITYFYNTISPEAVPEFNFTPSGGAQQVNKTSVCAHSIVNIYWHQKGGWSEYKLDEFYDILFEDHQWSYLVREWTKDYEFKVFTYKFS